MEGPDLRRPGRCLRGAMRSALACLAVMDLLKVQVLNSLVFLALGLPLPIVPASLGYLAAYLLARRSRGTAKGDRKSVV